MKSFLLAILLLCSLASNATNYYVDASTTSSTQNGSLANPWKTLSQVTSNMNSFSPGDFISFKRGGTYAGQLVIDRSGTSGNPITFNAYGTGDAPLFSGTGNTITYLFYIYNRAYITFDGLNITDPTLSLTDHSQMSKIQRVFYIDGTTNNVIIKHCTVSLAGIGVYLVGSNNTIDSCTIQNLRMVVNTSGGYDDYGANAVLISSSNNKITNNSFLDCWAPSYDFIYDGGALEIYGSSVNNNFIGYNTIINNCGLTEIASSDSGTCSGTVFAYNKLINNGDIFFIHNQTITVSNLQFYNNVIVETVVQRVYDNSIAGMNNSSTASGIVVLKNNIFWLSTGIDVARSNQFTGTQMTHEDNIYRLGTNSVLNFTQTSSEMITTANNIFTNTTPADPATWNFTPVSTGPAIDFGQNVGLVKDFVGAIVPAVPNAGLFETAGTQVPALVVSANPGTIACNGGSTTVTVTATGGTTPYTGTGTFNATAGTFTYTVTDATGSTGTKTITITQPAAISTSLNTGTIASFGGTTTITVIASGGSGTYTYKLDNGAYQASTTFTGITAGIHTISVKDASNCIATKTITITQPGSSTMAVTATASGPINCNGATVSVTVNATGGTAPYTGTGTFTVTAGTYTYSVTDASYGVKSATITISQPTVITATVTAGTITVYGGLTSVSVTASGGTTPYTYKLGNGSYQSSNIFSNVAAGDYIITVKDAKGCLLTKNLTITQPVNNTLAATATAGTILCNAGTTTVTVSATGGTLPYTGTGTFTVAAGTFTYTVSDANAVTRTVSVTTTQPAAIGISLSAPAITVYGGLTSITVTATGGTGAFQYKKNSGSYQSSNVLGNVNAGTHTITVKDANGCTATKTITITQPPQNTLLAASSSGTISCNGGTTSVTVTATGGTTPYTGTGTFTVSAGTYTYTVTDATGYAKTTSIVVAQPLAIVATVNAGTVAATGGTTSVTASATGGTSPYTYKLNNGSYQSSGTFNGVAVGNHTITVKDSKGCTAVKSFSVSLSSALQIKLVSKTNNSCINTWDGTITVGATGGTAPYLFQINSYGYGTTATFINLGPATYTLYAKDATGTISSMSVTILASTATCKGIATSKTVQEKITSDNDINELNIEAYPNPTSSVFYLLIKNSADEMSYITVMNLEGKIVEQSKVKGSRRLTLGRELAAGTYIVRVQNARKAQTIKIVKTN